MSGAVIVALRPKESPQQDIEHIASIYRNLSSQAAQQVIAQALGELAQIMTAMAARIAAHELADVQRQLRRLDRLAQNLGLVTLAQVARDLCHCLQASDATAFAAVWARLLRVLEYTATCNIESQDLNSF
jgi:hypothetical protein